MLACKVAVGNRRGKALEDRGMRGLFLLDANKHKRLFGFQSHSGQLARPIGIAPTGKAIA